MMTRRPSPGPEAVDYFCHVQALSGIALLLSAIAALAWANSSWASAYERFWQLQLPLGSGQYAFNRSLQFWISDGLMALFFLLVGLEIRREIHEGTLATFKVAVLPVIAALGGIVVPAVIYIGFNREPHLRHGWAIPTATDIAFATGALALLGRRVPQALRVFLLAIAVIDDVVAILLIAVVYSTRFDLVGLSLVAIASLGLLVLQGLPVRFFADRLLLGALVWIGLLKAGAHPALAGVVLGLLMPVDGVRLLEQRLHHWVAFGVMPLYAFANAGIRLGTLPSFHGAAPLIGGVIAGLIIGKPLGITLSTALCLRAGWCRLPVGMDIKRVLIVGCIAGMGFTMSIFICHLAFADEYLGPAKLAVLLGSAFAALVGLTIGRSILPSPAALPG
jgi:Na+:H+ antiporter, NhaA family